MTALFTLEVVDAGVQEKLSALIATLSNTAPIMQEISLALLEETEQAFAHGGMPPWHPLAVSTIKRRTKQGSWPGQILQVTGQLAASVTSSFGADFAQIGSNKPYAAIHQFGGQARHHVMEARP
ncbi:MAG: phage virion morphogenesis protein, partial [Undibacterium sp.]|nr:phage virion morphogenesis protein [Undibacterium sp.]